MARFREADIVAGKFVTAGAETQMLINEASGPKRVPPSIQPDEKFAAQAAADAQLDRTVVAYDGVNRKPTGSRSGGSTIWQGPRSAATAWRKWNWIRRLAGESW